MRLALCLIGVTQSQVLPPGRRPSGPKVGPEFFTFYSIEVFFFGISAFYGLLSRRARYFREKELQIFDCRLEIFFKIEKNRNFNGKS